MIPSTSPATERPPEEGEAAPAWAACAAGARLTGVMEAGGAHLALFLELPPVPATLAGRRLRLCLGETGLLLTPLRATGEPPAFGPIRLTEAEALRHAGLAWRLASHGLPPLPPGRVEGAPLEAMGIATEEAFFAKVQLCHSRFEDPLLLRLGARAGWRNLPGFAPRAAALTVLAHRMLERDLRRLAPADRAEMEWICAQGRRVVAEGQAALAATPRPQSTLVRWTTSLAMACALLALCQDDLGAAGFFFGTAAAQTGHVAVAPVAAVNLVQACLMQGLLLAIAGEAIAARAVLERGVRFFQPAVAAQDVMADVRVIGDMIAAGRVARQCYIALAVLGMVEAQAKPRIHPDARIELRQLAAPVARILEAGLCPRLARGLERLGP